MVQGPLNKYTTSQQPPQSSSIPTHPPQSSSQILPVPPPPPRFLDSWKKSTTGRQFTYRALFWKFCIQEMWCKESLMHKKQLVKLLMRLSRAEQSLAATGKRWLWLIQHNVKIYYIVDIWTATGIRVQPTQGKVLKSLAAGWCESECDLQPKVDEWMADWLTKQQPAPDEFADSTQHPASRASVQYIHENHAKNGWPVHDEDIDMNLLNARHGP